MKQKAFTLIEILIVIVVIGILSAFILVAMSSIINSANDAKIQNDITSLQKIIIASRGGGDFPTQASECQIGNNCTALQSVLIPNYYSSTSSIPRNPKDSSYYTYQSTDGSDFSISGLLSNGYTYQYTYSSGFSLELNGVCGSANGGSFSSAPSSNLCSSGNASSVTTDSDPDYIWTCSIGGGTTANCTANISKSMPCGILGDVDEDSSVTKNDYSLAYYYVPIDPFPPGADVNNNSGCDYDDVVQIYQYLIGGQSSFSGCP